MGFSYQLASWARALSAASFSRTAATCACRLGSDLIWIKNSKSRLALAPASAGDNAAGSNCAKLLSIPAIAFSPVCVPLCRPVVAGDRAPAAHLSRRRRRLELAIICGQPVVDRCGDLPGVVQVQQPDVASPRKTHFLRV